MQQRKPLQLEILAVAIMLIVWGCQENPIEESRTLLHKGTIERIRTDGELDEQYRSISRIEIFVEDGEIVDATIHLIGEHRGEVLLLKGGEWEIFTHMVPRIQESPLNTPTVEPLITSPIDTGE